VVPNSAIREDKMTQQTEASLTDEDMETTYAGPADAPQMGDSDGTDGDGTDGTDGDAGDSDGTDGTDGDGTDGTDGAAR